MRSTKPCNKAFPCADPFVYQGKYNSSPSEFCIKPEDKYILISECMNACLPDDSDATFDWYQGGNSWCRLGYWENTFYEDFHCKCKKRCPPPSGPYV